jgi:hypothetical protein
MLEGMIILVSSVPGGDIRMGTADTLAESLGLKLRSTDN